MFEGMTPWGPIAVVVVMAVVAATAVWRSSGRVGYGLASAALVLALASAGFGTIATVSYFAAVVFLLVSAALYLGARA